MQRGSLFVNDFDKNATHLLVGHVLVFGIGVLSGCRADFLCNINNILNIFVQIQYLFLYRRSS